MRHSDRFHEHVTLASSQPRHIVIYCSGAGNQPPDPEPFPNAIIFCITGGKSFALTNTRGDGPGDARNTIDGSDLALANLL